MQSVRTARKISIGTLPPLCILDFDRDLTDWLVQTGLATRVPGWPGFHSTLYAVETEGMTCGITARTIGGPYAVLIAEQLAAAGVEWIIGLTSAGRISPELPPPCLTVATTAIRDEETSLHYLAPGKEVDCPAPIPSLLARELPATGWPVRSGTVWTTDAPNRETTTQLQQWAHYGVAVEMQAASLFAMGQARGVAVGLCSHGEQCC
jgi:uridine phosphorylase